MKCSMHIGKKFSKNHNLRNYEEGKWNKDNHIDRTKSDQNIIYIDKNHKEFFKETFEKDLEDFNSRQKNKDRKMTMNEFFTKNKKEIREVIFQIGDKENHPDNQTCKNFFDDVLENWKEKNPNMKILGAYLHFDEATPHLHLDFIPVCESNRGMKTKVSLNGALEQQGYKRGKEKFSENNWHRWEEDTRKQIENIGKKYVPDLQASEKSGRKHLETWEWKMQQAKDNYSKIDSKMKEQEGNYLALNEMVADEKRKLEKLNKQTHILNSATNLSILQKTQLNNYAKYEQMINDMKKGGISYDD